jgi:hypothetical protein
MARSGKGGRGPRPRFAAGGLESNVAPMHLSPEAESYFAKHGCEVLLKPTAEAIGVFNQSHGKKIGLFHVTC